jgi:uncharacterized protein
MLRFMGRVLAAGLLLFAGASNAQVVVSQVYGGGGNTGAPFRSDFIELHNNGVAAVDLSTWSVQYASSTGTTWARTNLTGSIAAGGYYLVKQADGAGTTLPALPTPDATGTIAMSGTAGKVALVNNQTTLTGACPLGATVADFVGFGTGANCSETSPTPAPSNTLAVLRAGNGCTDSGNNSADFATGAPTPRNSASPVSVCGVVGLPLLAVNDVSAFEGDSGTTTMTFGFGLSAPAGAGGVSITYTTADGTATAGSDYVANSGTVIIPEGATSTTVAILVNGDTVSEPNETFFVRITAATGATISDNEGLGTIQNDDVSVVAIPQIQGSGLTSPLIGTIVTTEGIVTAQKFNNGFFLQSANDDGNPATSEGIFVFTSTAPPATATVGNRIRVTGTVVEFTPSTDLNQLSITEITTVTSIQVLSTGNALPAPIALTSTDFNAASTPANGEKYEGMRVSIADARVVASSSGNITESSATSSTTGEFMVTLPGVARPFREPGLDVLDLFPVPAGKTPPRFDHNPERLLVRSRAQIGATALAVDVDAQVSNMSGVLDYFSGNWALLPDPASGTITGGKTPTPVADARYDDVTIGGFNLERFFDEVNDSNGAVTLTAAALDKRLTKTGSAICSYLKTPDILGVVEVENLRVLGLLADRINATCPSAPAYVPYLVQGNDVGGINVGFLVSNRIVGGVGRVEVVEVTQYGKTTVFTNPNATTSLLNDRPPLLLRAIVHQDNGATFPITVIINHLRSLNGLDDTTAGTNGWPTEGDRIRNKRGQQAVFLGNLVQTLQQANPNERILLLGDFNAYQFSDGYVDVLGIVRGDEVPADQVITHLPSPVTRPLVDGALLTADPNERYSYVFDGNAQTLDHALLNEPLVLGAAAITVDHARINADFGVHHYGETGNAIRVSDHDPVRVSIGVADFRSADLSITAGASPANVAAGGTATFTASVSNAGPNAAAFPSVALVFDALVPVTVASPAGWTCAAPVQANNTTSVTCTAASLDAAGTAAFSAAVVAPSLQTASTLKMVAAITSQTRDRANADNSASAQVAVAAVPLPSADLSLRMVGGPAGFIRAGSTALFSVPVRNTGPNAVSQAVVTFTGNIPLANANVIAPPGWTCTRNTAAGGFSIACTFNASFGVNGRHTFTFSGVAPSQLVQSSMTLSSRVSAATITDPVPSNDASVYSVNIVAP